MLVNPMLVVVTFLVMYCDISAGSEGLLRTAANLALASGATETPVVSTGPGPLQHTPPAGEVCWQPHCQVVQASAAVSQGEAGALLRL